MKKNKNSAKTLPDSPPMAAGGPQETVPFSDLLHDPDYLSLQKATQEGCWEDSEKLFSVLAARYPGSPELEAFQRDFEIQYSVVKNVKTAAEAEKKKTLLNRIRTIGISAGVLLVLVVLGLGGLQFLHNYEQQQQQLINASQIQALGTQVDSLLQSGQPEKAAELIVKMKAIDAANPLVVDLSKQTDELIQVNEQYTDAQARLQQGQNTQALAELNDIQASHAGYRDVPQLIEQAQNAIQAAQVFNDATTAYNQGRWLDAINGFEQGQTLDPNLADENTKKMLLNSYLHQIIVMLSNGNSSTSDLDQAEAYYRRAVAMIPQNQDFLTERQDLQKISSSLIEQKYLQNVYALIQDPNQSLDSVNQAASYLQRAANLDPKNVALQSELANMLLYQSGFRNYGALNWQPAIDSLSQLVANDASYANGYAEKLLYEAYVSKGQAEYATGAYANARKDYETAETIVWNRKDLADLFTVEVNLGNTLGQLNDYKDAASYYKYAVDEVANYRQRAASSPDFVNALSQAIQLYTTGKFEESYNLFTQTLTNEQPLFTELPVAVKKGANLALIAAENKSSVQAIWQRNALTWKSMYAPANLSLLIPTMADQPVGAGADNLPN